MPCQVLAFGVDEVFAFRYLPDLVFHVVANGEYGFLQLPLVYLRQEVGLVFHGVRTCREPFLAVYPLCLRVVASGYQVVVAPHLLVERPKLYQPVAHHVGVGRKSGLNLFHGVAGHFRPILLVAVHDLQLAAVSRGHCRGHFQVFLRAAVPFFLFLRAYLYVKAIGV